MPTILISDEAMQAIRAASVNEFEQTGVRGADGRWRVPLSAEVLERLTAVRLEAESWSDTIIRVIRSSKGAQPS